MHRGRGTLLPPTPGLNRRLLVEFMTDGAGKSPGNDPGSAYYNVLFATDAARAMNNGHPEFWVRLLDKLDIRVGNGVYHVGAGTGYYTATMLNWPALNAPSSPPKSIPSAPNGRAPAWRPRRMFR